jgi:hypothetical protein
MGSANGAGPASATDSEARESVLVGERDNLSDSQNHHDPQALHELVLAELQHLALRLRLIAAEVDTIRHRLHSGYICTTTAQELVANLDDPIGWKAARP